MPVTQQELQFGQACDRVLVVTDVGLRAVRAPPKLIELGSISQGGRLPRRAHTPIIRVSRARGEGWACHGDQAGLGGSG